jgi:peptidyl-prolyl cis-trans isomerase A (cyclophilin A)
MLRSISRLPVAALLVLLLASCSGGGGGTAAPVDDDTFVVRFQTSEGVFRVQVHPAWAPLGAQRFRELVEAGYYDEARFFRIVPNFVVQFGINGDPAVSAQWRDRTIADDPVRQSNLRGFVTFAKTSQPNSRTTQVFINLKDNASLNSQGFAPFGQVIEGMAVVDALNAQYGESPSQQRIYQEGNAYLNAEFPALDFVLDAVVE